MDELDLKIDELLSALASLVNKAGRSEPTTAENIRMTKVPTGALREAARALAWWEDSEYTTEAVRQACRRIFD